MPRQIVLLNLTRKACRRSKRYGRALVIDLIGSIADGRRLTSINAITEARLEADRLGWTAHGQAKCSDLASLTGQTRQLLNLVLRLVGIAV